MWYLYLICISYTHHVKVLFFNPCWQTSLLIRMFSPFILNWLFIQESLSLPHSYSFSICFTYLLFLCYFFPTSFCNNHAFLVFHCICYIGFLSPPSSAALYSLLSPCPSHPSYSSSLLPLGLQYEHLSSQKSTLNSHYIIFT